MADIEINYKTAAPSRPVWFSQKHMAMCFIFVAAIRHNFSRKFFASRTKAQSEWYRFLREIHLFFPPIFLIKKGKRIPRKKRNYASSRIRCSLRSYYFLLVCRVFCASPLILSCHRYTNFQCKLHRDREMYKSSQRFAAKGGWKTRKKNVCLTKWKSLDGKLTVFF